MILPDARPMKVAVFPSNFREDGTSWLPVIAANGRLIQGTNHLFESIAPDFLKPAVPWNSQLFIASPNRDNSVSVQGRFIVAGDDLFVSTYDGWARMNTRD